MGLYGGKRRSRSRGAQAGYYRIESPNRPVMQGFSDGEFVRLRDEFGREWKGVAEVFDQDLIRLRFRDEEGNAVSGVIDRSGIVLRDSKGKTWRGFAD
jgi:hypothetical protein